MNDETERQLVRRLSQGLRSASGPCPSELDLASYADGLAGEAEASRIEAHLAACAACLDGVVQARQLAGAPPAAPAGLLARAGALVPLRQARRFGWRAAASWAAAAAACVALGIAGLESGSALGHGKGQAEAAVMNEISFQPPERYRALLASEELLAATPAGAKEGCNE
mgnify:CR=1 FL=1